MSKRATAFWSGREDQFNKAVDSEVPKCLDFVMHSIVKRAAVIDGTFREGVSFRSSVLSEADTPDGLNYKIGRYAVATKIAATECADVAISAIERLASTVKSFTGNTKNDIASMKAAAERVSTEVERMESKYIRAQQLLTSQEFQLAIENAERMASALDSISRLQHTRLTLAVFDGASE